VGNRPENQPINRKETPLTDERIEIFLADLAEHGIAVQAARKASPLSTHIDGAISTFRTRKRTNPHFAARWQAALEVADSKLLAEAHRRAVTGVERKQFFKGIRITETDPVTGKEVPVSELEYSDRLLELVLKARFPRLFIERKAIEHYQAPGGWQITAEDLNCLDDRETEQLQNIMGKVMTARGEIVTDEAMVDITPDAEPENDDIDAGLLELERMK